jgi:hypothetical protein
VDGGVFEIAARMTWEDAESALRPPQLDGVPVEVFVKNASKWPDFAPLWNGQLEELVLSNFEVRDGRIYRRLPIPEHMKIVRELWEQKTSSRFGAVRCPALIIPAIKREKDPQRAAWLEGKLEAVEKASQMLADARVVVMEDTIHDIPVQRPRELASLICEFAAEIA